MLTPALQFAISLVFVYLLLSALCSTIQEIIANLAKWRANTLETAIENLLGDAKLKDEIYNHALVKGIWRPRWLIKKVETIHKPAYISSAMFAQALQDLRTVKGATALPAVTQKALDVVLKGAATAEEERKRIEHWFDDAMDAVSGWYKRKAYAWLWVISAVVCVVVNADTISIGKVLWDDPTARTAVAEAAKKYVESKPALQTQTNPSSAQGTAPNAQGTTPNGQGTTPRVQELQEKFKNLAQARSDLNGLSIPLGWCSAAKPGCPEERQWPAGNDWILSSLRKSIGILLTILAVSQGAPFWFDLLQKFVNLRLAGDPPPDSRAQR